MSRYQTPQALRRALEDRLLALVRREGGDINRLRRQTAFDRLLCRLFREANAPWLFKGGNAMELRIQAARTTRDIDLAIRQLPGGARQWDDAAIRSLLENAAAFDLEDSFEFIIGEQPDAWLVEAVVGYGEAGSASGFRAAVRLAVFKHGGLVLARPLWVQNSGAQNWKLVEVYWFCRPSIGGSIDDDVPGGVDVPDYYRDEQFWTDSKLGGCFGALGQSDGWLV